MKNLKLHFAALLVCTLGLVTGAFAQITPSADSYTNTVDATTNYGANTLLNVDAAKQASYIQFDLSSIPAGASVSQATLKLYVNAVPTAGSFNVDFVDGTWAESTISSALAPALGTTIASSVPLTAADKNQYILINITPAVTAWLNGSQANDGIALVANGTFNASFDSKENAGTSHPPELDIVFAGDGTITGVTTEAGGGLMGGGASGSLNLSLTNSCAANQVLQWNGSSWACSSAGSGTVTSISGGTGLTGGTITGSGTLSLAANACPAGTALSGLPFTCSPVASLGANTFIGNQTVSGNLSATGVVTGSGFQIGSSLFAFGSSATANAFLAFAGNPAITVTGTSNTASGYQALFSNVSGSLNTATGVSALHFNTGSNNTATGGGALSANTSGTDNTASGVDALFENMTGRFNSADGANALLNNTAGNYNTAIGNHAGTTNDNSNLTGSSNTAVGASAEFGTGTLTNATAIGAAAEVTASNSLVLGAITGVNGATTSTKVGIGTTAPAASLDVHGTANFTGPVSFAAGQAFPGVADVGTANTFTATQTISSSTGNGVSVTTSNTSSSGLFARNTATSGNAYGVYAQSSGSTGTGVFGSGAGAGVTGNTSSPTGSGVVGQNFATTGNAYGVYGQSSGSTGTGVFGTGNGAGVTGSSSSPAGSGVVGTNFATSGNAYGVYGQSSGSTGTGVYGIGNGSGVIGVSGSPTGSGVLGVMNSGGGYAGYFQGNVAATGTIASTSNVTSGNVVAGINSATSGNSNGGFFTTSSATGTGVVGENTAGGYAGFFQGNVAVTANASVGGNIAIGGDLPMSHSPRMTFSGYVPTFVGNQYAGYFIPDQPIVIMRMTITVGSGQNSVCSFPQTMQVITQTGSVLVSVAVPNAGYYASSVLNIPIAAGTGLLVYGVEAQGASTLCESGNNIMATVEYAMQ